MVKNVRRMPILGQIRWLMRGGVCQRSQIPNKMTSQQLVDYLDTACHGVLLLLRVRLTCLPLQIVPSSYDFVYLRIGASSRSCSLCSPLTARCRLCVWLLRRLRFRQVRFQAAQQLRRHRH